MRVTVLTGGATAERAVAFAGAAQVVAALRSRGHEVWAVDTTSGVLDTEDEARLLSGAVGAPPAEAELPGLDARERGFLSQRLAELPVVRGADVVFLVLHSGRGEGGGVQAVLELLGVPYTGSGPLGSALAMDKDLSKRLFRAAGVPVPAWYMAPVVPGDIAGTLGWPVIVKPSKQGSTVGLSLVKKAADLPAALAYAAKYDDEVMAEQFVPGRELTVGVLGDVPLPVGEITPRHELFDYECKYTPGMSEEVFPAKLDTRTARQAQELALAAHRALKLGGFSRVDFRLTKDGDIFCLEANTLPGMTRTSLLPQAARAAGIEFPELCERICALARNKQGGGGG
ncbi:MAG TPA: D-alanine--D-alanine ligase [Gemmatimonadales bacterium]|nr:D-alanine--D-alanine ligase [Gemmatimonadales bacterium]